MKAYDFILMIVYAVEPFVWISVLSKLFKRRNDNWLMYFLCWLGSYLLICIKQIFAFSSSGYETVVLVLLIIYYIVIYKKLFECKFLKLILCLSCLFLIALVIDTLSIGLMLLVTDWKINDISQVGYKNVITTYLSKCILIICCFIYRKAEKGLVKRILNNTEMAPVLFACVIWEIPNIMMFNNMKMIGDSVSLFFWLVLGQAVPFSIVLYMKLIIDKHRKQEMEFELRMEKTRTEMELCKSMNYTTEELYKLKHDLNKNIGLLKHLYDENKFEDLGNALSKMTGNLEQIEMYYTIKNGNVAALLNQKRMEAKRKNIEFDAELMIDDFGMDDIDICSLISNILDNAIEANLLVSEEKRFINLKIMQEKEGFKLECINSYNVEPLLKGNNFMTNKKDNKVHGLGIKIIRTIVTAHNGTAVFDNDKGIFSVTIYIPYK